MRLLHLLASLALHAQLPHCPATLAARDAFTVCYDTQHQRPLWTLHTIKPSTTPPQRKHWRKDHELNSLSATAFTNTGFHRGHLVPSADAPESSDTFLTSNAIAQNPALNMGAWRSLENLIRKRGPATVVTGAVYANCGNERIEAPCQIFKVAFFADGTTIAAILPNAPSKLELTTPEDVQRQSGLTLNLARQKSAVTRLANLYPASFQ